MYPVTLCTTAVFVRLLKIYQVPTREVSFFFLFSSHPEWLLYTGSLMLGFGMGSLPVIVQQMLATAV